jgi:hypothetical protein
MADGPLPRPVAGKKQDNRRALIFAAVGLGLLLIAYLGTHVLSNGKSAKAASASIRASITTATVKSQQTVSGIVIKPRLVTAAGPQPNTTRDPFARP